MSTLVHWRRRAEISALRWQARLDTRELNRTVPWAVALLIGGMLTGLAFAHSHQLDDGVDLATHLQAVWLINEGYRPISSVIDHNLLWEQGAFILYPVAGLTALFPDQSTLLSLQAAALALGVVPLWRIARDLGGLKTGASAAVMLAYCLYPAVHSVNLSDFHLESLAVPALFFAVYHGLSGRWVRFGVYALIVVMCRSDLAFALSGLGLLIMAEGRRRAGATVALASLAYGLLALLVIQPAFNAGEFPHLVAFDAYGEGNPGSVLWGFITGPHEVIADLTTQTNFRTIVFLLAPVMLLPLVAPRYVLPVAPLFALYLLADVPAGRQAEAAQMVPVTVFMFVATVFALNRAGRVLVERVNVDRRLLTALALTATIFFLRDAPSSPYQQPWDWNVRDSEDVAITETAELIPDDVAVRASPLLLPELSERTRLYPLDATGSPDQAALAAADGVEWIVLDESAAVDWSDVDLERFHIDLEQAGFEQVASAPEDGLRVYRLRYVTQS